MKNKIKKYNKYCINNIIKRLYEQKNDFVHKLKFF